MIDTRGFREDLNAIVLHHDDMEDDNKNIDNNKNNDDNNNSNIDEKCKFTKIAITQSIVELGTLANKFGFSRNKKIDCNIKTSMSTLI